MAFQTFTGIEYLKIDIANNFGLDKESWNQRLDWFDENEGDLMGLIKKAEEPALFYAGILAYEAAKAGKPSGYPISLDATSSGIQFLSVLTCDRKAALLCNVLDSGRREDAYTLLYERMLEELNQGEATKAYAAVIKRKDTKNAIMTAFYNSTAVPKKIFGEGILLDTFYATMKANAPGAWELTESMPDFWDEKALVNEWIMPDNFHVRIKVLKTVKDSVHFLDQPYEVSFVENMPTKSSRSLGANMTHSIDGMAVREITRRCMYDPAHVAAIRGLLKHGITHRSKTKASEAARMVTDLWANYKNSGFVSFRIFDYLDSNNIELVDDVNVLLELLDTLPPRPFEVLAVHDCFRVLPNYGNDIRRMYNRILFEIARSNLLSNLLTQITGRHIRINKLDPTMIDEIMDANYALS